MNIYDELVAVVRALQTASVDYALVGGLAVGVWGAPRATKDIDLLVRPEDVARAKQAVRGCGYTLEAVPMRFSDGMELERVSKIVVDELMTVDFLLVNQNLESIWQSRLQLAIENASLCVISRQALIAMKTSAGRPIDEHDVIQLCGQDR
jgi:hypothetical protein